MNGTGTARVERIEAGKNTGFHTASAESVLSRWTPLTQIPLRYRLPILIGVMITLIISIATWAGYRTVKESALSLGQERLKNLTEQLAALSQQSSTALLTKTVSVANDPVVLNFFAGPSVETRTATGRLMEQFDNAGDQNFVSVELRTIDGGVVFSAPAESNLTGSDLKKELGQASTEPFRSIGPIRVVSDRAVYPVVAATKDATGKVIGYLVRWRRISATPQTKQQLADLLGSQTALYLGNADGSVWTDLVHVVPPPPVSLPSTLQFRQYRSEGQNVMGMGRPIAGTPWFVLVEFPDQIFLKQSSQFLWGSIVIGSGLLLLGLVSAFLISESIVRPIRSFTDSAVAISGGDYTRTVNIRQKDELGVLADSFNEMVVKVRNHQNELEQKVQERTAQLEQANHELEAFSHLTTRDLRTKSDELTAMTQQLWQASKLATMGELAASIAHELNNPLATVALHVESLISQLEENNPKRRSLEVILNETERMATLVSDLLQFSRRSYRQLSTFDIRDEITNSIEFIRYFLKNRNIEVVLDFDDILPTVQADRQQLRQVFLNLMTNATDAMPGGGRLTIRAVVTSMNASEAILIEFIDNGEGITEEHSARVWEPFFTTKPAGKGTGLGLAICRRVTEEHGGRISLISESGKGTVVSIVIPAAANGDDSKAALDAVAVV